MDAFRSILLPVPEAEGLVDPFRREGDWARAHGVPAHLTLAGPFPLSVTLPREGLGELAADLHGTQIELASVGMLGEALCLFPADDTDLLAWRERALRLIGEPDRTDASWRPHLTVCRVKRGTDEIGRTLARSLPVTCEIGALSVAEMDAAGRVSVARLD